MNAREEALEHDGGRPPRCTWCGNPTGLELDHIDGGGNQHRRRIQTKLATWLRREGYPPGYQILCHECHQLKSYGKETPMPPANGKVGKHFSFQDDIAKLIKDEAHKRDVDESQLVEDAVRAYIDGINGHAKHLLTNLHQRHVELTASVNALTEAVHTLVSTVDRLHGTIAIVVLISQQVRSGDTTHDPLYAKDRDARGHQTQPPIVID